MGFLTTFSLVVASMVGTGVFTTAGMLVAPVPSAAGIVLCWVVGGGAALCGALAYAELGTALPEIGGEYRFLSRLLHPAAGFLSAFVSLIVGFSAPLALLALAFGDYLAAIEPVASPAMAGATLIVVLSALNGWRVSAGTGFHNAFTVLKVGLVGAVAAVGIAYGDASRFEVGPPLGQLALTPGFAGGLLLVSFSYTGWNAAAYVAGEVKSPAQTLPRALLAGTLTVTTLYVALNAAFLMAAPLADLAGEVAVGHVAAVSLFGDLGGRILSGIIALGLVSTVGALIVTGPRVYEAVGRDFPALAVLSRRTARGGPWVAISLQAALALVMLFTASFDDLLGYVGFTLSLSAGLTVASVFRLRALGFVAPFQMMGYPVTPALFVALTLWMAVAGIVERPGAALAGAATLLFGGLSYMLLRRPARQ